MLARGIARNIKNFRVHSVTTRLTSLTATQRLFSQHVVKSPVDMPELSSEIVDTPLPTFVLKDFLSENRAALPALVDGMTNAELTFGDLYYHSHSMADSLRDMGVKRGDIIAIIAPNHLHYLTAFLGISLAGGVSTPVNPLYSEKEMKYQFEVTNASTMFVHPLCLERVLQVIDKATTRVIVMDHGVPIDIHHMKKQGLLLMSELTSNVKKTPKYDHDREIAKNFDPHSLATVPFSSGTTGRSKGVMLTHKNLVSNVLQALPFEGNFLKSPKRAERGTLLCPLPFFHIYGLTAGLLVSTYVGSKLIFMAQFDLIKYLEIIQTHKVTRGFVVPPIVLALTKHPVVDRYDLTSLECLVSAAAPLGFDVQVACAKRLKCLVKQAWGMTEISPCGAITPDDMVIAVEKLNGTSGKLVPGSEGKIVDSQTGLDLDPTQEGELLVRGPHIMKGYLNDRDATEKTIRADGWMHTGDIGRFDQDGWLYLTDRMKELIKYKGFQVPPAELEAVIASMPEVKDVIVIPVPDDEAGEVPRAYVVKQDHVPKDFGADDIIEFVHANVSPHKRLRGGVIFTDVIPKSPSGKLLRRVQIEIDRQTHESPQRALK